ncbi:MAG TPA: zf-HC2 domain-containing protein [Pyrinomonadaceae bacterium]|nr:zf-HC2 domain-containing protein [Pyrinomonadaceae bacterium]
MTHGDEFRIYMKVANRDQSNQDGPHLNESRMFAYYRGELSEAEREEIQVHLITCAECIALFRSLSDFLEPARTDEENVTIAEMDQQWQLFWERVNLSSTESDFEHARSKKFFLDSRLTLAMAASLLISLGAIGWLAWSLWQERRQSQEMAAELERKQQDLEQRLAQLTESTADQLKREREQRLAAEASRDQLQDLLADARPPGDDTRVFAFTLSSDRGSTEELQLKLSTAAEVRLLISKPGAFNEYEIDLVDQDGRIVRKFQRLRPKGVDRVLRFRLNRGALGPGKYRLRLLGQHENASTQIGEHVLLVTGPT